MNSASSVQMINSLCSLLTGVEREGEGDRRSTGETIRQDEGRKMRRKLDWYEGVEKEKKRIYDILFLADGVAMLTHSCN